MIQMPAKSFWLAALIPFLAGCPARESVEVFVGPTMGSTYSVKYVAAPGTPDTQQLQAETEAILAEIDRQMSSYRKDSDIERFNELPANSCMPMPPAVLDLVAMGEQLSRQSEGAFDLTVSPLLQLWGFGPHGKGERIPAPEEIAAVRQRIGHQHLRVEGDQLCKDAPVEVDFNSIAAGYAVDRVTHRLEALGVSSYLVEITGELKAKGRKPDGSAWRIALEAPLVGERTAQRIVELDGVGVSTSGDYRNYFERDGRRYSHTIDPQSGAPITHRLASVTVADASVQRADGLSTLLMVLGPERGLAFATREGLAAFFIVHDGQGFTTQSSAAFDRLFGTGGTQ